MSESLNNLFDGTNVEETVGRRNLAGTAQLTIEAGRIAGLILQAVEADFENLKEHLNASKVDHAAMDELIAKTYNLEVANVDFLKELPVDVIEGMLKSQQSKRSRTKGKVMTMDNYRTMLTAAVAENLIRTATGKEKMFVGSRRSSDQIIYTQEELDMYAADQDKLRKEIRNVQSKKSIMKAKEDFSEEDQRWLDLLVAEEQLKSIRVETVRTVAVDQTKSKLAELLNGVDISTLKASDAKKLLGQAAGLVGTNDEPKTMD